MHHSNDTDLHKECGFTIRLTQWAVSDGVNRFFQEASRLGVKSSGLY